MRRRLGVEVCLVQIDAGCAKRSVRRTGGRQWCRCHSPITVFLQERHVGTALRDDLIDDEGPSGSGGDAARSGGWHGNSVMPSGGLPDASKQ